MSNSGVCERPVLVGEIMTCNPRSIGHRATLSVAATLLSDKDIGAAPVIDDAGRPIGVLSRTDIVRRLRARAAGLSESREVIAKEIMNPVVYFVRPDTPVSSAIDDLLDCGVQRLFVVDDHDALVGVVSTVDVIRHLRLKTAKEGSTALPEA